MKHVKMFEANSAWYSASVYSSRLIKSTGLQYHGGFLSLAVLANHLAKYKIAIKVIPNKGGSK